MSKYNLLWQEIKNINKDKILLTFEEISKILGFEKDHSFLNYKKELEEYGYKIDKILLKTKIILVKKL